MDRPSGDFDGHHFNAGLRLIDATSKLRLATPSIVAPEMFLKGRVVVARKVLVEFCSGSIWIFAH